MMPPRVKLPGEVPKLLGELPKNVPSRTRGETDAACLLLVDAGD